MKNNIIDHKGYYGSVDYSAEDNILFGSVIGVRGLISYEGKSIDELKADFEEAVDSYLEMFDKAMAEYRADPVTYSLDDVEKELGLK